MKFKPFLAVDATDNLDTIRYPKYVSYKLDGIRCIFHPELGMVSRSLKPIQNKQLQEKFRFMNYISKKANRVYDGELYAHELSFQEITRVVMTKDFTDEKTILKFKKEFDTGKDAAIYVKSLINKIKFHCFDTWHPDIQETFYIRNQIVQSPAGTEVQAVKQVIVNSKEEVEKLFKTALDDDYEGLILKDPAGPYKMGRSTLKEEYMLKVKPFKTFDAEIIGVQQATEVDPSAEKKINELGRSVTSKKKDDRILIEKASAFWVNYGEHRLKVSLAMTDEEKIEVWKNRESYMIRMIEYKGMIIGSKDVPRHPVFVRFRDDRK